MSKEDGSGRNNPPPHDESTHWANPTHESRRRSSNILQRIDEDTVLPSLAVPQRSYAIDQDEGRYQDAPRRRYSNNNILRKTTYQEDYATVGMRPRNNTTSYAAPTRASRAKKNEKVEVPSSAGWNRRSREIPSRPESAALQGSSAQGYYHQNSPVMQRTPGFENGWNQSAAGSQVQSHGGDAGDTEDETQVGSDVGVILDQWKREKEEVEEDLIGAHELGRLDQVEQLKVELERLREERDEALRLTQALQHQLETTQDEDASLQKNDKDSQDKNTEFVPEYQSSDAGADVQDWKKEYEEVLAIYQELEAAAGEHDDVKRELQSSKADVENLKQKYDALLIRNQELEEKIEARNQLEPGLPLKETPEIENRKLRKVVVEKEGQIVKLQIKVGDAQDKLGELKEFAEQIEDEAFDSNKKLEQLRNIVHDISEAVGQRAQTFSGDPNMDIRGFGDLMKTFVDNAEATELIANIDELMGKLWQTNVTLAHQMGEMNYEILSLKKTKRDSMRGFSLPNPGITSPTLSPRQADRDGFESLYKQERERRKAAEETLQERDAIAVKEQHLELSRQNEQLQSDLQQAQEELADLRKQVDELHLTADSWKDESEQSKRELEKRSDALQSFIVKQRQEEHQYIKEYHDKTLDESHWEVAPLQEKLQALEQDNQTLKQLFDRSQRKDIQKEQEMMRLAATKQLALAHIDHMEQAYHLGIPLPNMPPLPTLPTVKEELQEDDSSDSDSICPSSCPPSPVRIRHAPIPNRIPRCQLPARVKDRKTIVAAYRAELKAKTDQELLRLAFNPQPYAHSKKDRHHPSPGDEIMEKVRKWKLGRMYPPTSKSWDETRKKSPWERWGASDWIEKNASGRDLEIIAQSGVSS